MPCLCPARTYLNRVCRAHTLLAPAHALQLPHTNAPPQDNCPALRTLSPSPIAPSVAPAPLLWHTTCALPYCLCSRLLPHPAPWPDAHALPHFPALPPCGSTLPLVQDRRPLRSRAHT